jgi:integrase
MGTDLAVQKELLRHADIKTTMNIYTQAMAPAKRKAIRKLTQKLLEA